MMNLTAPTPSGEEIDFYKIKINGVFDKAEFRAFLGNIETNLDEICREKLFKEEVSLLGYCLSVLDKVERKSLVHQEGGCWLAVGNPSRKTLIRGFQKRYKNEFNRGYERMMDEKSYNLSCYFHIYGFENTIRKK